MKNYKSQQIGVGLFELFVVLLIIFSIIFFSIRQYMSFQNDADVRSVQNNVDILFFALANYFQANCNITDQPHPDTENFFLNTPFAVTVDELKAKSYLTSDLARSPLIQQSTPTQGYVLQFNPIYPPAYRTVPLSSPPAPPDTSVKIGQILMWQTQVSVSLQNTDTAASYQKLLLADCLSNQSGGLVTPCSNNSGSGNFAVFMHAPTTRLSTFWGSTPLVKQFTQMYTTSPILSLTNENESGSQFYVCSS